MSYCIVSLINYNDLLFAAIDSLSDVLLIGKRSYLTIHWPTNNNETQKGHHDFNDMPIIINKQFHTVHYAIEFQLRPLSERGLLLYFGAFSDNLDKSQGFVSLSIQGGIIEFRVSGPDNRVTIVRSTRMLALGEWHKVRMVQNGRRLTLWVEGTHSTEIIPSGELLLESRSRIYIGGLPDLSKLTYNAVSGFAVPYKGCIRKLLINGKRHILNSENIIESQNIEDCDGTPCGEDSCESGGECWLDDSLNPHCKCPKFTSGNRCEVVENCKLISCKNGGKCLESGNCLCSIGWMGRFCDIGKLFNSQLI